ncbi:peptidoglycan-binding protein [Actinopolymorpha sp. NPDC004070]|uniref:efflux RND transporter periplasmic adaptor subunit n=1 Tax=Actinopolymorpha sp. NPDC004070 TaxID=3154548 RepID=UPI0033AE2118
MSTLRPDTDRETMPDEPTSARHSMPLQPPPRRRLRRRLLATGAVVVVLAAGVVALDRYRPYDIDLTHPLGARQPAAGPTQVATTDTALATVIRQTLSARTSVDGTLGYAGSYNVINQARGVLTALPEVGQTIERGQVLYRVDGKPVVLMYGNTPVYRDLAAGEDASDVTGQDVQQLNANLVALGYAGADDLDPDTDEFGWRTTRAVKELQDDLGMEETGKLTLGQVVFAPTALRVITVPAAQGTPAGPGASVLQATSTARQVTVNLNAAQQSQLKVGDQVSITLPDDRTTPGRVAEVGKVATKPQDDQDPTIEVRITPTRPRDAGTLDQAPVKVAVTTGQVTDATVVPVEALLALAGGGYAVEVVAPNGTHRLVRVTPGLFDDDAGVVEVTDTDLASGQRVVVPAT